MVKIKILVFLVLLQFSCAKEKADWQSILNSTAGQEEVNISSKELGDLNLSLENWRDAKRLILPYNSIGNIKSDIRVLQNLEILNLYGNPIIDVPTEIWSLPKLKVLLLGRTKISKSNPEWLKAQSLEIIALDETDFAFTDQDVEILSQLKKLKKLDLTLCRKIKGLPKDLQKLNFLEELVLQKVLLEKIEVARLRDELPNTRVKL